MFHRHQVVEIGPDPERTSLDAEDEVIAFDGDGPELIDETVAPAPVLGQAVGRRPAVARASLSAVPSSAPMTQPRPSLPWGLGTDGWPRHNSRLVRLFACDPDQLLIDAAGLDWGSLHLSVEVRRSGDDHWPGVICGTLQMPYPSRPLDVELRVQPFHDRYSRVDVVLCSHRRWPRRYFDVASRCLTEMHRLERAWTGGRNRSDVGPGPT